MLTLNDERSELWQWDTGRTLSVPDDCSQVHFSNKVFGRSVDVDVVDGVASIPDILLQIDKELTAWAFVGTAENGYTKISKVFKVNKRNKPADYVFTPTDQTTLGEILDRIEDLENRPGGDVSKEDIQNAVNDYLDKNPVSFEEKDPTVPAWAKQPEKPTYTAAEVGALPADGGIPIPPTASVGQTIVVKAVDEDGKPTEWEAADFPSEGRAGITKDTVLESDVSVVTFDGLDNKRVIINIRGCVNNADRTLPDGTTVLNLNINDINYVASIPIFIRNNTFYDTIVFIECVHGYCSVQYAQFSNAAWNIKANVTSNYPYYTKDQSVESVKKLTISVVDNSHVLVAGTSIKVVAE